MIFENATIHTLNPLCEVITHGAVAITSDQIISMGRSKEVIDKYPEKRSINCNGKILIQALQKRILPAGTFWTITPRR
jgi:predicted amidohydrolase YtcJ